MMLCPLNVVLKLDRFVNVSCSFNIRGEHEDPQDLETGEVGHLK